MASSHPVSPASVHTATSQSATPLSSKPSAPHFAAYHSHHRDLCRHAASLPRQLSDHFTHLQTLRSASRTFASHLSRLLQPPPSAASPSVLRHFTAVNELLRVAVMQQLDTALVRLAECVGSLDSSVDSMARLCDSLRAAATAVDVELLTLDVATVRELKRKPTRDGGSSAPKASPTGGSAGGSHRKQRSDKKQAHRDAQTEDDAIDPALNGPVSPYSLLLTLEDIMYMLTEVHQQHTAALVQLQTAVKRGGDTSEEMCEALDVLSASGDVSRGMLDEWLSIIRRACKA